MPFEIDNKSKTKISVEIKEGRVCIFHYRFGICFERRSFSAIDLVDGGFAEKLLNSRLGTFDMENESRRK